MTLQAYQQTLQATETPRETEYRLFGQVTRALIEAKDCDKLDKRKIDALDWNRRVWTALMSDCSSKGNSLPEELRAQIISLGLWVSRYSSEVMREGESMDPLISVNRAIMEGLNPGAAAEAAPQDENAAQKE